MSDTATQPPATDNNGAVGIPAAPESPPKPSAVRVSADLDFAFDLTRGMTYQVPLEPLPLWFQFFPKGRGLPLVVVCPFAADRKGGSEAALPRSRWLKQLPYNVLQLQDPTVFLSPDLHMGWCLGTAEHWPVPHLVKVVESLRDQLAITNENIVFLGLGPGGFNALQLSTRVKGSCALINNPDIEAKAFRRGELVRVLERGYSGLSLEEAQHRYTERFSLLTAPSAGGPAPRIFCLQHKADNARITGQLIPFFEAMNAHGSAAETQNSETLIIAYYADESGPNRPANAAQLTRVLEQLHSWFATPSMRQEDQPPIPRQDGASTLAPEVDPQMIAERRAAWAKLLPTEIMYWDTVISGIHSKPETVKAFRERAAGRYPVPGIIIKLLERLDVTRAKILDVGAGPHTTIGATLYGTRLNITAVDPLADAYDEILAKNGIEPCIRTIKGEGEALVAQFGTNRFDIVHSRNALDHTYDPWIAIQQMIEVCVPGGAIHIVGSVNEGLKQKYLGLHQWNFLPVDTDLVIWNAQGGQLASNMLSGVTQIRTSGKGAWFQCTMFKRY